MTSGLKNEQAVPPSTIKVFYSPSQATNFNEYSCPTDGSCLFWAATIGILAPTLNNPASFKAAFKNLFIQKESEMQELFDNYGEAIKDHVQ